MVKGPRLLVLFPLLATFLLMVTGITHQFREWLHVLMLNKRRRRAIIAFVATSFLLLVQVPNIINIAVQSRTDGQYYCRRTPAGHAAVAAADVAVESWMGHGTTRSSLALEQTAWSMKRAEETRAT